MREDERIGEGHEADRVQIINEINGCSNEGKGSGSLRTYKRRKLSEVIPANVCILDVTDTVANQAVEETTVEPGARTHSRKHVGNCEANTNYPNGTLVRNWRSVALEQMCESYCEDEEGILGCIRDALKHPSGVDQTRTNKEAVKEYSSCRAENVTGVNIASDSDTTTSQCQHAFFKIIISEHFTSLCKLLLENFKGMKIGNLLDFHVIESNMKDGAYEHSPELFLADIEQLWRKFERIGSAMLLSASNLLETSRTSCCKCIKGLADSISEDWKAKESDAAAKLDQLSIISPQKIDACRICSGFTDGKDCLVCDSCEGMYHVACIKPAVEEIPSKSWFCEGCIAHGVDLPHDGCVVCERLNADTRMEGDVLFLNYDRTSVESGFQHDGLCWCKVCGGEIDNSEKLLICTHPFCPNKFYHPRCLTTKQLKSQGSSWYCPSCLCVACLTDRDDDMIVLCDGCNNAYHLYCMNPPHSSVPEGQWFCQECEAALLHIQEVKRAYQGKIEHKKRNEGELENGVRRSMRRRNKL